MFKKMVVLFVSLVVLSGIIKCEEKDEKKFSLKFGLKTDSWKTDLKKERFLIDTGSNWRNEFVVDSEIKKSSTKLYMEIDYSPFPWVKANANLGVAKTKLIFSDTKISEEINYTWNNSQYSMTGDRITDSIAKTRSKMGFFYGVGIEFITYRNGNFSVSLQTNYSYQKVPGKFRIYDFERSIHLDPYDPEIWRWGRYIEIEKTRIKQIELGLNISGSAGKFNFSGGPMMLLSQIDFSGSTCTLYGFENHYDPEMRPKIRKKKEFKFIAKNQNPFGIFGKLGYNPTENSEIFFEFTAITKNAIRGGILIKF